MLTRFAFHSFAKAKADLCLEIATIASQSGEDLTLACWPMASRNCSGPVKKNVTGPAWPVTF